MELLHNLKNLPKLQQKDDIREIYTQIQNSELTTIQDGQTRYRINDDILYQRHNNSWLIVVLKKMIDKLFWECHYYYLHCGPKKCSNILQDFIFGNMIRLKIFLRYLAKM